MPSCGDSGFCEGGGTARAGSGSCRPTCSLSLSYVTPAGGRADRCARMIGGSEPVNRVRASPAAAGCAPRMSCDAEAAVRFARDRKIATRALQACNANSSHRLLRNLLFWPVEAQRTVPATSAKVVSVGCLCHGPLLTFSGLSPDRHMRCSWSRNRGRRNTDQVCKLRTVVSVKASASSCGPP